MSLPPPDLPPSVPNPSSTKPPTEICAPVKQTERPPADEAPDLDTYSQMLRDAITYPWRRGGPYILIPGAFLALALSVSAWAPVIGLISVALGSCYFAAFYFSIVENTFSGRHRVPDWPEFADLYDDLIRPGLQMAAIFIVCKLLAAGVGAILFETGIIQLEEETRAGGLMVTLLWLVIHPASASAVLGQMSGVIFALYFPMAVIGVVANGHVGGALPHRVIPAILRCLPGYLLGVAWLFGIGFTVGLLQDQIETLGWLGILPGYLLAICLLIMQARFTGTLGLRYAQKIA